VVGARLAAAMAAGNAAFQLGGGLWYEYWYGEILQVVDGVRTGFCDDRMNTVSLFGISKQNDSR
jgi:hypothetical protein